MNTVSRDQAGAPVLRVRDYSYTYAGAETPALAGLDLELGRGECLCLAGASGSGKSTLLLAAQGLLSQGQSQGEMALNPPAGDGVAAGLVFQNAETQLLCATVEDEVSFGPHNLGWPAELVRRGVARALVDCGLEHLGSRNVEELSAGQKQRLALAAVLAMSPRLLLLDEPSAQLDAQGRRDLVAVLGRLKARGTTLLVADHNLAAFASLADRVAWLRRGRLLWSQPADLDSPPAPQRPSPPAEEVALSVRGLKVDGPGGRVLDGLDLQVRRGELVHILGANGAGKSTLLRSLAGLLRPRAGTVSLAGVGRPRPERLLGSLALLFQNPQRQLFEDQVLAELAFSPRRLGLDQAQISGRVEEALALCELEGLARRSPLALSFGEQHRVALASLLGCRPRVLLCDEPFAGLDPAQRRRLLTRLRRLRRQNGTAVVIASHDPLPWPDWAHTRWLLREGRLVQA
ncbi:MAG: ATP-binding cassette domain-containing protein [Pseudomonadota bacterium]